MTADMAVDITARSDAAPLTIGAVARQAGVATSAIRYYETIGLLPAPVRLRNGQRRYEVTTVQRLRVIERAQRAGFTLGEIRELFFGFAAGTHPNTRWEALAQRKLSASSAN
jgi:MerR family redox-sensitive transcriptional activator SoxR